MYVYSQQWRLSMHACFLIFVMDNDYEGACMSNKHSLLAPMNSCRCIDTCVCDAFIIYQYIKGSRLSLFHKWSTRMINLCMRMKELDIYITWTKDDLRNLHPHSIMIRWWCNSLISLTSFLQVGASVSWLKVLSGIRNMSIDCKGQCLFSLLLFLSFVMKASWSEQLTFYLIIADKFSFW